MTHQDTILIVDCDTANLKLLVDTLVAEGYQALPANSGELALAKVTDWSPELILLDIRLPDIDGFEVLRRLKAREESRNIPVIFLSAVADVADRVGGFKLGAVDFITKPFQREELLARIQVHLELRRLRVQLEQRASELRQSNDQIQRELALRQQADAALAAHNQEVQESRLAALNLMSDAVEARNRMEIANQQMQSEITVRKQVELELRASEQEFRSLAEAMPQIVWATRPDGWNIYFNQQWVDYTGLTLEESYGHGWNTPFHPDDRQRAWDAWQRATQKDETYSLECRLRRFDGVYRWWLIRGVPQRHANGEILKWFGTCTDIEDIKHAEEAQVRLLHILESSLNELYIFEAESLRFEYVNRAALHNLGYSLDAMRKMTPLDLKPEFTEDTFRQAIAPLLSHEQAQLTFNTVHRRTEGSLYPVEVHLQLIEFQENRVFLAVILDITARKQVTENLRASEERFRRAMVDSPFPILLHAEDGAILQASNSWCEITGYTREELTTIGDWTERAYGERKHLVQAEIDALYGLDRRKSEGDYTIRTKSGETRIWEFSSAPLGRLPDRRRLVISMAMDVTERRRAEDEVRKIKNMLMRTEAIAHLGSWEWDMTTDRVMWSDEVFRLFGLAPATNAPSFAEHSQCYHPEDRRRLEAAIAATVAHGTPFEIEVRVTRQDGEQRICLARGHSLHASGSAPYLAGSFMDITERQQAAAALCASEERFRRAVEDSPFPILLHAEDGTILHASNSWCEITGYTREELSTIGDWTERAFGERKTEIQTDIERLYNLDHKVSQGDYTIRTKSGETRTWEFSSAPLGRLPDKRRLVISMAMDVTERRRAESEVQRLNLELEQRVKNRTAQLEAANRELEAFSYSVSHDLRAPLRAIDGFTRILSEDYTAHLDAEGQRLMGIICNEAKRMGQLIDDLLAFSRMNRREIVPQEVNMDALAKAVFAECLARSPNCKVQCVHHALPTGSGDVAMLCQVWVNLIANAIKFTRDQAAAKIEIGGRVKGEENLYFVKDNGVGFDMKYVGKLFGVFQRLHTQNEFEGTGVGLALVQRIVQRHGGRVWAEGKLNEGATFYFTLPGRKSTEQGARSDETASGGMGETENGK
jgi:PAS domain S-box-containing protein